jgi:dihydrofolate reductase
MPHMNVCLIAAIGKNGELGRDNGLIWHIPGDLAHFKTTTMGHTVIMGRKTFESIGRPLPGRTNIVVTRSSNLPEYKNVLYVADLKSATATASATASTTVFIIGGASLYTEALPIVNRMYITHIDATETSADTFFPSVNWQEWVVTDSVRHEGTPAWTTVTYTRL